MTIYAAGLRRSEAAHLQVNDIDSARMTITVRQGKGQKDRLVMLSPVLLQTLRQYWRHNKPKRWLFPGENPDQPISDNDVFAVFKNAVRRAGITKKVSPHSLRQQLCNTPTRVRHQSAHHPDPVGASQPENHGPLPPCFPAACAGNRQSSGWLKFD
jgi:integrase